MGNGPTEKPLRFLAGIYIYNIYFQEGRLILLVITLKQQQQNLNQPSALLICRVQLFSRDHFKCLKMNSTFSNECEEKTLLT